VVPSESSSSSSSSSEDEDEIPPEDDLMDVSDVTYSIQIQTSSKRGSGTQANIWIDLWCAKRHFLRCHLYVKRSFYQDRLGTNMGKTQKKSGVFRSGEVGDTGASSDEHPSCVYRLINRQK
jgi:hypothetical protein